MRFPIRPFDHVPHIDFMHARFFWIWSSFACVLLACVCLATYGLNYGIDFVGGKMVQVQTTQPLDIAHVRTAVEKVGFEGMTIQEYGAPNEFLIRLPGNDPKVQPSTAETSIVSSLAEVGQGATLRRVEFVGPQVGQELRMKGFMAMLASTGAILLYVWMRFEFRYGLGAILSLCHDVILTMGILSFFNVEMTLTVLAAILTLIGYSLNDTIVIFDRVRENRGRYPNRPLLEVLNLSVNQTLGRTFMTVSTVVLVLLALFFWGGEVIHDFSLVLLVGTAFGTYSSVFVASPLLLALEEYYQKQAQEEASRKITAK
jgi:preprotein translocase subunit SecF